MPRNVKTVGIQASLSEVTAGILVGQKRKIGSKAAPVDVSVRVLTEEKRSLHRPRGESSKDPSFQAGASCAPHGWRYSLMHNQSFQPTSHSSLRSSRAAAELQR